MATLAVVILTKNEEKNIKDSIASASFADDILVVDSGSQDNTEKLVKEAGARFIYHPMGDDGFAGQRNFALEQINTDWVFYLDADERITDAAAEGIQNVVKQNIPAAYNIKRYQLPLFFEMWLSLVERCVRDAEVAGSNPVASIERILA